MIPTNEERRVMAIVLRNQPTDMQRAAEEYRAKWIYGHSGPDIAIDYYFTYHTLLGCFPPEDMGPRDYRALHERLADFIDPMERICRFRWVGDEMQCSACGWLVTEHDADFEYYVTENTAKAFRYCPFCGAKVADE